MFAADTANRLALSRLTSTLEDGGLGKPAASPTAQASATAGHLERFHHFAVPTLAHLLALLCHPSPGFPPPDTRLVVVDTITTLFDAAYPSTASPKGVPKETADWIRKRKWNMMGDVAGRLARFATTHNLAVLVLSQTITKMHTEDSAILSPVFNFRDWKEHVSNRIALFQDFSRNHDAIESDPKPPVVVHFAAVVKANQELFWGVRNKVSFSIDHVCSRGQCSFGTEPATARHSSAFCVGAAKWTGRRAGSDGRQPARHWAVPQAETRDGGAGQ